MASTTGMFSPRESRDCDTNPSSTVFLQVAHKNKKKERKEGREEESNKTRERKTVRGRHTRRNTQREAERDWEREEIAVSKTTMVPLCVVEEDYPET